MEKICCSQCEFCVTLYDVLRSYGTRDTLETAITIRQRWAWCDGRETVTWAEQIDDVDTLLEELGATDADQKDVERRLAWRRTRRSPARCLECGGASIHPFSDEVWSDGEVVREAQLEHPGCGGTLASLEVGFGLNRQWIFYTAEGEKIEEVEASPTRGLVEK